MGKLGTPPGRREETGASPGRPWGSQKSWVAGGADTKMITSVLPPASLDTTTPGTYLHLLPLELGTGLEMHPPRRGDSPGS